MDILLLTSKKNCFAVTWKKSIFKKCFGCANLANCHTSCQCCPLAIFRLSLLQRNFSLYSSCRRKKKVSAKRCSAAFHKSCSTRRKVRTTISQYQHSRYWYDWLSIVTCVGQSVGFESSVWSENTTRRAPLIRSAFPSNRVDISPRSADVCSMWVQATRCNGNHYRTLRLCKDQLGFNASFRHRQKAAPVSNGLS